jgi:pimeloyl-ACP methyl ester carboxylesterase
MGQLQTRHAWTQSISKPLSFAALAAAVLFSPAAGVASGAAAGSRVLQNPWVLLAATTESRGSHATVVAAADSSAVGSDGSSATAVGSSTRASTSHEATALQLFPCELEHPQRLTVVAADCGALLVPEDPTRPGGRQIRLAFARIPAISRRKQPDALFLLAGGPGMAATTFYAMTAPVFARIHRERDIVLVDQRGTGRSNPLNCPGGDETDRASDGSAILDETRRCLQALSPRADVALYTTSVAVKDLDRVRQTLGYQQINLYGVSYGTRVAQHYLRRYPQHTRSLILDGVVPPELSFGAGIAIDAERSLERILARCAREDACQSRFGDPQQDYHSLWTTLQAHPVPVSVGDPSTGALKHFEFTTSHFATVLRLSIYSAEPTALLPLLLHETSSSKDFSRMAAQYLLLSQSYTDVIAVGMNNTVACTEDIPFYDPKHVDRVTLEHTFLGATQLDALFAVCKIWPHGPLDPDFHAPLHSTVPALLLSGSDDPITPPVYGEEARRGLSNSLHVILQDFGHGQLAAPCVDRVMEQFIDRASVAGLDVSCTRNDKPTPFFISINGPPP